MKDPEEFGISGKDMEEHTETLSRLIQFMIQRISNGFFPPIQRKGKGNCDYCGFSWACFASSSSFAHKLNHPAILEHNQLIKDINFSKKNYD